MININEATNKLFDFAKEMCWNVLCSNCYYFFSKIDVNSLTSEIEYTKLVKKNGYNLLDAEKAEFELQRIFNISYDINFYVFIAKRNITIIEIRYLLKDDLCDKCLENKESMVHWKIPMPIYARNNSKYDINWKHKNFRYICNMLIFRIKFFYK